MASTCVDLPAPLGPAKMTTRGGCGLTILFSISTRGSGAAIAGQIIDKIGL